MKMQSKPWIEKCTVHTCMHMNTKSGRKLPSDAERSWEGSSFRHKVFMLMLLNNLWYLYYCYVCCLWKKFILVRAGSLSKRKQSDFICVWVSLCVMGRFPKTPDSVGGCQVITLRLHLRNWTVARGDSLGTPLSVQNDRKGPQDRQPGEIMCACVYLCTSVDLQTIGLLFNQHSNIISYITYISAAWSYCI